MKKINKLLLKYLTNLELEFFLNKKRTKYYVSINEVIALNKNNQKIVLENLKSQIYDEAMGA